MNPIDAVLNISPRDLDKNTAISLYKSLMLSQAVAKENHPEITNALNQKSARINNEVQNITTSTDEIQEAASKGINDNTESGVLLATAKIVKNSADLFMEGAAAVTGKKGEAIKDVYNMAGGAIEISQKISENTDPTTKALSTGSIAMKYIDGDSSSSVFKIAGSAVELDTATDKREVWNSAKESINAAGAISDLVKPESGKNLDMIGSMIGSVKGIKEANEEYEKVKTDNVDLRKNESQIITEFKDIETKLNDRQQEIHSLQGRLEIGMDPKVNEALQKLEEHFPEIKDEINHDDIKKEADVLRSQILGHVGTSGYSVDPTLLDTYNVGSTTGDINQISNPSLEPNLEVGNFNALRPGYIESLPVEYADGYTAINAEPAITDPNYSFETKDIITSTEIDTFNNMLEQDQGYAENEETFVEESHVGNDYLGSNDFVETNDNSYEFNLVENKTPVENDYSPDLTDNAMLQIPENEQTAVVTDDNDDWLCNTCGNSVFLCECEKTNDTEKSAESQLSAEDKIEEEDHSFEHTTHPLEQIALNDILPGGPGTYESPINSEIETDDTTLTDVEEINTDNSEDATIAEPTNDDSDSDMTGDIDYDTQPSDLISENSAIDNNIPSTTSDGESEIA